MKYSYNITTENNAECSRVVSPQKKNKSVNFSEYTFTWLDVFIVVLSTATFIADIITDVMLMLVYWKNDEEAWAALTLAFFIVPAIIMQVFSIRWYLSDGHKVSLSMVISHLIMMGPVFRYIAVLRYGFQARKTKRIEDYQLMYSELSDVSMLRLFECFLESAPQLVLQLHIMITLENDYILTGISACFSLLSLSWAIVAYTRALRAAASIHRRVSWTGAFVHGIWRGGMLLSRLMAILMFATVFQEWTLLFLGLHWLLMTSWIIFQDTDFCNSWWEERLFNMIIGIIYVFCFFNMKEGRSRYRVFFYYTVMLIENSVMILLWWQRRTVGKWYNTPALCSVWGGFALGLFCMVLYYIYFHPASKRRCHCCMAWRILTFRCQSCCYFHQDTVLASPYKKVETDRHFFDSTGSSDEILDPRDFTELRRSYVMQQTEESDSSLLSNYADIQKPNVDHIQRSTSLTSFDQPPTKSDQTYNSKKVADFVVVGNAETGFRVKQIPSDGIDSKHDNRIFALPQASSTPGDNMKIEPQSKDNLVSTPRRMLSPRSPNTLVKNWVKKTQEMYESNKAGLADVTKNANNFASVANSTTRRNPLRMKSFSKKDRVGYKPSFFRKGKKERSDSVRNSFREAFGFHVVDLDRISEHSRFSNDAVKLQTTSLHSTIQANSIRNRIDRPPSPVLRNENARQTNHKRQTALSNAHKVGKIISEPDEKYSDGAPMKLNKENITCLETAQIQHGCCTAPSIDQDEGMNETDRARQSARKKLTFKPTSQLYIAST